MKLIESEFVLSRLSPLISAGAADELRVSYQPEDGEADRPDDPAGGTHASHKINQVTVSSLSGSPQD